MLVRFSAVGLLTAALTAGCGSSGGGDDAPAPRDEPRPAPVVRGLGKTTEEKKPEPAADLGFPAFATKNTTRVGGSAAAETAAGVALAVFPSRSPETRPGAVTLADRGDWRAAISAAQLMSRPLRAPLLFSDGDEIPPATESALDALAPAGVTLKAPAGRKAGKKAAAAKPQLLRVGAAPAYKGLTGQALGGKDFAEQARAIDRLAIAAAGKPSASVLVAAADQPAYAMPAAGWAAKAGTPVLWVRGSTVPPATRAAIRDHGKPRIYLLGPAAAIPDAVAKELGKLGRVKRIAGRDPVSTAVAFARYSDGGFGWNAVDPGHGFVFASAERPADAAAAAPLSASGAYAPLLLVSESAKLDKAVEDYLLDVQPGYDKDPVRGVYNHGWLMGDAATISVDVQSRIDALLEIQPVDQNAQPSN
jgi:hypothetical protein